MFGRKRKAAALDVLSPQVYVWILLLPNASIIRFYFEDVMAPSKFDADVRPKLNRTIRPKHSRIKGVVPDASFSINPQCVLVQLNMLAVDRKTIAEAAAQTIKKTTKVLSRTFRWHDPEVWVFNDFDKLLVASSGRGFNWKLVKRN